MQFNVVYKINCRLLKIPRGQTSRYLKTSVSDMKRTQKIEYSTNINTRTDIERLNTLIIYLIKLI